MTIKQFWADPYQKDLRTHVQSVEGNRVRLRSTIFFAFSGGQESDAGTINGFPVLHAEKEGKEITYTLPDDHGLVPDQPVDVAIDWERRYRLMRLHFAAELVLELTQRNLPSVVKIGAHIGEEKARIDFALPESIAPMLPGIAAEANRIIMSDRRIRSVFSDEVCERRYWEIPGFARVPCGGTHLKKTGEIGPIRLKRKNIGRGKERIEIVLSSPPDDA